jgi:hypothetical protein
VVVALVRVAVSGFARFVILLFALSVATGGRRRMNGVEGWGRHLRTGSRTVAKEAHALTHPSNLASPEGLMVVRRPLGVGYAAAVAVGGPSLIRVGSYRVRSRSMA